jgi:hypothetical protein
MHAVSAPEHLTGLTPYGQPEAADAAEKSKTMCPSKPPMQYGITNLSITGMVAERGREQLLVYC